MARFQEREPSPRTLFPESNRLFAVTYGTKERLYRRLRHNEERTLPQVGAMSMMYIQEGLRCMSTRLVSEPWIAHSAQLAEQLMEKGWLMTLSHLKHKDNYELFTGAKWNIPYPNDDIFYIPPAVEKMKSRHFIHAGALLTRESPIALSVTPKWLVHAYERPIETLGQIASVASLIQDGCYSLLNSEAANEFHAAARADHAREVVLRWGNREYPRYSLRQDAQNFLDIRSIQPKPQVISYPTAPVIPGVVSRLN